MVYPGALVRLGAAREIVEELMGRHRLLQPLAAGVKSFNLTLVGPALQAACDQPLVARKAGEGTKHPCAIW